tara:strand:+ start:3666 stop:3932 length:267 start_codon:yes stop_codon:yes gene_type:complete
MSNIVNASLDLTKIEKSKIIKGKKGSYINITMFINDENDQYGNNASVIISQTKEEREAKTPRVYLGNGRTVGNNQPKEEESVVDGLNF